MIKEGSVLKIHRIEAATRPIEKTSKLRETAERVHEFHARFCPVARSIEGAIEIATRLELV